MASFHDQRRTQDYRAGRLNPPTPKVKRRLFDSFWDPIVLVALIGSIVGGVNTVSGNAQEHDRLTHQRWVEKCDNAYEVLKDETLASTLSDEQVNAFIADQLRIAAECGRLQDDG